MTIINTYQNGNYRVSIFSDGSKVRHTNSKTFKPEFPESIDLKITDNCNLGCPYCHENSTRIGLHGLLNLLFLDTLQPGTELAIGGGNPLAHPLLKPFLKRMKDKGIICNITINQAHLDDFDLGDLVYGVGVSVTHPLKEIPKIPNLVFHVINKITTPEILESLYGQKILVLGYKEKGRGLNYKITQPNLGLTWDKFELVSFDNLALEQLNIKEKVSADIWDTYFMGGDGQFTMYADCVTQTFASSSTSKIRYPILGSIMDIFKVVRKEVL